MTTKVFVSYKTVLNAQIQSSSYVCIAYHEPRQHRYQSIYILIIIYDIHTENNILQWLEACLWNICILICSWTAFAHDLIRYIHKSTSFTHIISRALPSISSCTQLILKKNFTKYHLVLFISILKFINHSSSSIHPSTLVSPHQIVCHNAT